MNNMSDEISKRSGDLIPIVTAPDRQNETAGRLFVNTIPMAAAAENYLPHMAGTRRAADRVKGNHRIKRSVLTAAIAIVLLEHGQALAQTNTSVSSNSTTALTLTPGELLTIDSGVTLNVDNGKNTVAVDGSGTIVNDGTLEETGVDADAGRAIRDKDDEALTLVVENYGTIFTGDDDDIQIQFSDDSAAIYNYGTIISANAEEGGAQAIDLTASTTGNDYVYNAPGALIEAFEADAVRPGLDGVIDNAGTIFSDNAPATIGDASDGIDAQTNTGVAITNESTGVIEGARHGITGGNTDVTTDGSFTMSVSNAGVIEGNDGSGINIDGFNANELVTVKNSGTINGDGVTGDGDGVDVDGLVDLTNTGKIVSEHAYDDASEGVTVGGGTIINSGTIAGYNSATNADGTVNTGVGRGITLAGLDKDPTTDAVIPTEGIFANSEIINSGLIYGQNGGAIAVTGAANNDTVTIINEAGGTLESGGSAAVVAAGGNDSTVIDDGTIKADDTGDAINLGSGNSTVEILGGSASVIGNMDGGTGTSTLNIAPGTGNSFTYDGAISDFATLTVNPGSVILDGDSASFTGATTIAGGGLLEVGDAANPDASLGGDVTVASGGMLRGHGTIDGDVTNDGVVAPGGSIGVLTINGNYVQYAGGTLNIELAQATAVGVGYDQLRVTGTASLAGTLAIQLDPTYAIVIGAKSNILTAAGGVTGAFSTVTIDSPLSAYVTADAIETTDGVTLELAVPRNSPPFNTGRIYAANGFAADQSLFNVMNGVLAGDATAGSLKQGAWMQGLGDFGSANGDTYNAGGFVAGAGRQVSPNVTIGAAVSSVWTGTNGSGSSVSGNTVGVYGYGIYAVGGFEATAMAGVGHLGDNSARFLAAVGTGRSASNGYFTDAGARVQYRFGSQLGYVAPYISGEYLHTSLGDATETGAGMFNLTYAAMHTNLGQFGAGLKTGFSVPSGFGTLAPWAELGGLGTLGNTRDSTVETLGLLTASESATVAPRGAVTAAAGASLTGRGPWRFSVQWGGQYGSGTTAENFGVQGQYSF